MREKTKKNSGEKSIVKGKPARNKIERDPILVKNRYFVEECDVYTGHFDHEILEWFGDLRKARQFADNRAAGSANYFIYRVYRPPKNANIFRLNSHCVYEARGTETA